MAQAVVCVKLGHVWRAEKRDALSDSSAFSPGPQYAQACMAEAPEYDELLDAMQGAGLDKETEYLHIWQVGRWVTVTMKVATHQITDKEGRIHELNNGSGHY